MNDQNDQRLNERIEDLKVELKRIRKQSLNSTREGDYIQTARLTVEAANLNREIMETETLLMAQN